MDLRRPFDEEASWINLPSGRVPRRASGPSRIRVEDGGGFGRAFMENNHRPDVLTVNRILSASKGAERRLHGQGRQPISSRDRGPPLACRWPLGSPSVLCLCFVIKIIHVNFSQFQGLFPKKIFEIQISRKTGTGTRHLVNRLVQ